MTDPWESILVSIEPEYIKLKTMLEKGNIIYADLSQRGKEWCIHLQEEPPEVVYGPVFSDFDKLDSRVNWCYEQLKNWPHVRRMAHDMWYFKRKRDALKFQVLYNLKWAE